MLLTQCSGLDSVSWTAMLGSHRLPGELAGDDETCSSPELWLRAPSVEEAVGAEGGPACTSHAGSLVFWPVAALPISTRVLLAFAFLPEPVCGLWCQSQLCPHLLVLTWAEQLPTLCLSFFQSLPTRGHLANKAQMSRLRSSVCRSQYPPPVPSTQS